MDEFKLHQAVEEIYLKESFFLDELRKAFGTEKKEEAKMSRQLLFKEGRWQDEMPEP